MPAKTGTSDSLDYWRSRLGAPPAPDAPVISRREITGMREDRHALNLGRASLDADMRAILLRCETRGSMNRVDAEILKRFDTKSRRMGEEYDDLSARIDAAEVVVRAAEDARMAGYRAELGLDQ
jgi:hypothetical protein